MSAEGYFYPIDTTRHERVLFGKVGRLGSSAPVVVVPKIPSSSNVEQLCTVGRKVDANYINKIKCSLLPFVPLIAHFMQIRSLGFCK
jgi:hypothetical protein